MLIPGGIKSKWLNFYIIIKYLWSFTIFNAQWNWVSKIVRKYKPPNRILNEIVKFIEIFRSSLNSHYVAKNCSTNLTIDVKLLQNLSKTTWSTLCTQIVLFECIRFCSWAYEICTIIHNLLYPIALELVLVDGQ